MRLVLTSSSKNESGEDERPVVGSRVDEAEHQHGQGSDDDTTDETKSERESFEGDILSYNHGTSSRDTARELGDQEVKGRSGRSEGGEVIGRVRNRLDAS